jgi:drug/metabolite transporter (DMT)-like permease
LNLPHWSNGVAILLAGLSALLYGAADFCGGLAARKSPLFAVLALSQGIGLVLAIAASAVLGVGIPPGRDLAWGALAGLCGAVGIATLYAALATTIVAVASPVAAVIGAAIPMLLGVATGDRPGVLSWVGITLAIPSIVLLTAGPMEKGGGEKLRKAVWLGIAAGVSFGLFFSAISRTSAGSGLWPLASARVTVVALVLLFALFSRRSLRVTASELPVVTLAGLLDMVANIAFLLACRSGMLTIVAVISSLYPGPTVLLAWLVLRERMSRLRVAGIMLALAGVALISARG